MWKRKNEINFYLYIQLLVLTKFKNLLVKTFFSTHLMFEFRQKSLTTRKINDIFQSNLEIFIQKKFSFIIRFVTLFHNPINYFLHALQVGITAEITSRKSINLYRIPKKYFRNVYHVFNIPRKWRLLLFHYHHNRQYWPDGVHG